MKDPATTVPSHIELWTKKHGSPCLKKTVLDVGAFGPIVKKLYLSERLFAELPDWQIVPDERPEERTTPSEIETDALALARKKWPLGNVRLETLHCHSLNRRLPVLIMTCPWNEEDGEIFIWLRKHKTMIGLEVILAPLQDR